METVGQSRRPRSERCGRRVVLKSAVSFYILIKPKKCVCHVELSESVIDLK